MRAFRLSLLTLAIAGFVTVAVHAQPGGTKGGGKGTTGTSGLLVNMIQFLPDENLQ